ncbi:hypothetical protein [Microbacterium aerolatum]|uniref:Uncharacterized protein n=1 Tax=Microbacterium aerolatum TaxID=153731 RepID=A0A511ACG6_9MICO|nr:hypothetical protein [Microbacterium aerolatum]GEK85696.1 hypothetical protein MAE01_08720 [Microbacterium aerolatum]GGB21100.1 hypothetical protein GCM10007198_09450 [Microbacterium aerolatum]
MTGDETENVPEPTMDAAPAAPAPEEEGAAPVALTPEEQAVPDFEVPEPPSFHEAGGDLPIPAAVTQEPVIPPAPVFDEDATGEAPAARVEERPATRRAAQRAQAVPSAPAVSYVDVAPTAEPGTAEGHAYRGWTIAIYSGLAVLLFGAVGFMVFLGLPG